MNKPIVLTAVITAVLTAALTTAGILGSALYIKGHQTQQAQSEQPAEAKPAAEEQAPATPPAERLAEQMAEHLAKPAAPSAAEAPNPEQVVKLPITREDFEKLVIGKTKDQVLRMVGKPDSRLSDSNTTYDQWLYKDGTIDPVTDKAVDTYLIFTNGTANNITYM